VLTAKITRSRKSGGGITATIPVWVKPSVGADVTSSREDENVVTLTSRHGAKEKSGPFRTAPSISRERGLTSSRPGSRPWLLRNAELDDALGGDLDLFARGRVAANACLAVHEDELTDAGITRSCSSLLVGESRQVIEELRRDPLRGARGLRR